MQAQPGPPLWGTGAFVLTQRLSLDCGFTGAAARRVNADGLPDLLVTGIPGAHSRLGGLYTLRNDGGTFTLVAHDPEASVTRSSLRISTGTTEPRQAAMLIRLPIEEIEP